MGKLLRNKQFLFLTIIFFLLAVLEHISGNKQLSSCSPFCLTSLKNSIPSEVFAANMKAQEPAPLAAIERVEGALPKKAIVHPEAPGIAADADIRVRLAHPEITRMAARELVQLLKKKADIVILDTQPPDGYEMWHIPSAVNIPYLSTADPMDRQLKLMALPSDKQIVIYCLCEEGADSAEIALELKQLGYSEKNIKVLEGGLVLWDAAGHPMVKQKIPE